MKKVGQKWKGTNCVSGGEITTIEQRDFFFKDCFFYEKKRAKALISKLFQPSTYCSSNLKNLVCTFPLLPGPPPTQTLIWFAFQGLLLHLCFAAGVADKNSTGSEPQSAGGGSWLSKGTTSLSPSFPDQMIDSISLVSHAGHAMERR